MVGSDTLARRIFTRYLPLLLYLVFLLFPFYWMLVISLKPDQDLLNTKQNPFWVLRPTIDHYTYLFDNTNFLRWALNTIIVTFAATFLSIVCSIMIGYALGRLKFPGANVLG